MSTKTALIAPAGPAWQPAALIRTKLYIPQVRPKRVPRAALLARLEAGLACKLTVMAAPAGFGKTTLLSDWIAASRRPAAWVSLDARDNDPQRFAAYVLAALGTLELGLGPAGPGRPPERGAAPMLEGVFTTLINQATEVAEDFALVLDDYHVITEPAIHAGLSFLLEHLPAQMHLVLTSRSEPPLPLAHWRARGQLLELRAADLRFTPDEVRAVLNETMELNLGDESTGTMNFGGGTVTAGGLFFVAATLDSTFRAFDVENGEVLAEFPLEVPGQGAPVTWLGPDRRQYVAVFAGGGGKAGSPSGDFVIAFRLPR